MSKKLIECHFLKFFYKIKYMSEILKNHLPKDLVRLIQSYLLPNIFDIYAGKIEINDEIRNHYLIKTTRFIISLLYIYNATKTIR